MLASSQRNSNMAMGNPRRFDDCAINLHLHSFLDIYRASHCHVDETGARLGTPTRDGEAENSVQPDVVKSIHHPKYAKTALRRFSYVTTMFYIM